jgi:HemY protein
MLWSLIKILLFVAAVAALAYGATWLLEAEGGMQIIVADTEFTLGPLQSVIALLLLVVALYVILKLVSLLVATLRFINGDETALSRHFTRNREKKGLRAITESLTALAAGDGKAAISKARQAEKYLGKPELTNILVAQGAELAGDAKTAEATYKKLLTADGTRFVGLRGILKQKLAEGDTDTALKLAERAFAIRPRNEEMQDTLLKLQAECGDWAGARKTLAAKLKHGAMPRDLHKRRDAVLALSEAREVLDEGKDIEAQEAAIEANRRSPDLIPAAVMAARGYIEKGKPRYAARILKKAWGVRPHPDLAAAFAEIAPDETPAARLKRFEGLVQANPGDRESKLLKAELNIAAEDFPAARRAVGDLAETDPDTRVLTVMAAIERGEGAPEEVVRGWLARAVTAPRGPQWVCDNCHAVAPDWTPICPNCGGFDTLSWTRPPEPEVTPASTEAMLPLIVGRGREGGAVAEAEVIPPAGAPEEAAETASEAQPDDAVEAAEEAGERTPETVGEERK